MFKSLRGRLVTITIVTLIAGWQLWTTYEASPSSARSPVKLGLDLQGGMHLVLEAADPDSTLTDEARADAIQQSERVVRSRIDEFGVQEPIVQTVGSDRLIVELAGVNDPEQARAIIQQAAYLEFKLVQPRETVDASLTRVDAAVVRALGEDSLRALGRAVEAAVEPPSDLEEDIFGPTATDTAAADSAAAAADTTAADSAAVETRGETELRPFSSLLSRGNFGQFLVAVEDVPLAELFLAQQQVRQALPRNIRLHWSEDVVSTAGRNYRELWPLTEDPFMTGELLEDAQAGRDPQFGYPQVQFQLSRAGGSEFGRFTSQHVGDQLAIVLDGQVVSAPTINSRIDRRGQIDLEGAPIQEANDLALVLRAGSLPTPLTIIQDETVGPSLGRDSIEQGRVAGILGLVLVIGIMVAYYRMAGVLAIAALAIYVILVMGGLAGLDATLTLPGIAGLILSVGMAVDANVLIFERIREELAAGRATRTAVDEGFGHALSAIVDANITTLITALILFEFGTGPVQGFAVTLSIGIVASFFSALYVTRTFFLLYLSGKKASDPISI